MRSSLAAEVERLRRVAPDVAWVAPPNFHLTLKFIGRIDAAVVDAVAASLTTAVAVLPAFEIVLSALGAFPSVSRPRVIWAGVDDGAAAARRVAGAVDSALTPFGVEPETRPLACHVTLGRRRLPRRDAGLADALSTGAERGFGRVRVGAVALMQSELSPCGARYRQLAECRLSSSASI